LVEHGVAIVSGLARGIDTAAHQATLAVGGRTIAVVGTGIDRTYPPENAELADQIAERGAIISQFPMGTPPSSQNFPMRNKTMALLSLVTVVVEAGEVSGAKMQADYALRLKQESVERSVFLAQSLIDKQGGTGWAREFLDRGAKPLRDVDDILAALPLPKIAVQHRLPL
jgi:DNA processing protein